MKHVIYSSILFISLLLSSCGGNYQENLDSATKIVSSGGNANEVIELLTKDEIKCKDLSPDEYGKLAVCLAYVMNARPSSEDLKKIKDLYKNFDKAGEDMSSQQLQEAKQCALQMLSSFGDSSSNLKTEATEVKKDSL